MEDKLLIQIKLVELRTTLWTKQVLEVVQLDVAEVEQMPVLVLDVVEDEEADLL